MGRRLQGNTVRLSVTCRNVEGTPYDPSAVVLWVRLPTGAVAEHAYGTDTDVVRSSVGAYRYDLPLALVGEYAYAWDTTGPDAREEGTVVSVKRRI